MTREEFTDLQEKIPALERVIMRDLDEREIEYLKDHTINDFLYDVLGFEEEDLVVLLKLQKAISDWCTRPSSSFDLDDIDWNLFKDSKDEDEAEKDIDVYHTACESTKRVVDVLTTLVSELKEELNKYSVENPEPKRLERPGSDYVLKEEGAPKTEVITPTEPAGTFTLDEAEDYDPKTDIGLCALLPENMSKWTSLLTHMELWMLLHQVLSEECLEFTGTYPSDLDALKNEDEVISNFADAIKDEVILNYVSLLKDGKEIEFDDEEIQMEVLDYLYTNNYKVKSINNKVSIL